MRERFDEPLSHWTTLGVGGPARRFAQPESEEELCALLRETRANREETMLLGGGSNVVVSDEGVAGCVVALGGLRGVRRRTEQEDAVELEVAAGEPFDPFVARCVAEGLAGLECLSGIPGLVGATPIQNVGAYGQEVSDCIVAVRSYDRRADAIVELDAAACGFAYRTSVFKTTHAGRHAVLSVTFRLRPGSPEPPRYAELARALAARDGTPDLAGVRETVLGLRRQKAMVLDPADPDSRSVGSFFTNPILTDEEARAVETRARAAGLLGDGESLPRFAAGPGLSKLPAAWLIERAGFRKGYGRGAAGLSSKHCLAIVNRGGAAAREVVALARELRAEVLRRFGVILEAEPVFVGFVGGHPLAG